MSRHDELVVCSDCKEWTTYGESCCGCTACDEDCEICNDEVHGTIGDNAKEVV